MEQRRTTPPRNSLSAGVSGAALSPAKAKNEDSGTEDNNTPDSAEDNPLQQDPAQEDGETSPHERAADREVEDDNYMPPSEDEASLDDDEFVVPEDPSSKSVFNAGLWPRQEASRKNSNNLELIKIC